MLPCIYPTGRVPGSKLSSRRLGLEAKTLCPKPRRGKVPCLPLNTGKLGTWAEHAGQIEQRLNPLDEAEQDGPWPLIQGLWRGWKGSDWG